MSSHSLGVWVLLGTLLSLYPSADVQMAMPMQMMPPFALNGFGFPPMGMPMPPPMMMPPPIALAIPQPATSQPKCTKPPVFHKPPCPPCMCQPCTPAFFSYCSPCHQKCRCKDKESVPEPLPADQPLPIAIPMPMPMPMPPPPPVVVYPSPPLSIVKRRRNRKQSSLSSSEETSSGSDESYSSRFSRSWDGTRRSNRNTKRHRKYYYDNSRVSDDELLKPVLSYVNSVGHVRFKTRVSNAEAAKMLSDQNPVAPVVKETELQPDDLIPKKIRLLSRRGKTARVIVTV